MLRVAGHLQKSTEVMKLVNDTMKLPEIQKSMMEMSKGNGAKEVIHNIRSFLPYGARCFFARK